MTHEPEKRGFIIENLILAWSKLGSIRQIAKRIRGRKVFKDLPETVKEDIKEIEETSTVRREE